MPISISFFFDLVSCFANSALVLHGTATTACAVTVVRRGDCASLPNQQYYHEKLRAPPRAACLPPRGFRWPSNDAICFINAFGPGEEGTKHLFTMHTRLLPLQTPFSGCMVLAMWIQAKSWLCPFTRDRLEKSVQLCNNVVCASER